MISWTVFKPTSLAVDTSTRFVSRISVRIEIKIKTGKHFVFGLIEALRIARRRIKASLGSSNKSAATDLSTLSSNTTSQLNIFGHDGHSLGVDSAQVGILEQANQIRFCGLLQGQNGGRLESKVAFEILHEPRFSALSRS